MKKVRPLTTATAVAVMTCSGWTQLPGSQRLLGSDIGSTVLAEIVVDFKDATPPLDFARQFGLDFLWTFRSDSTIHVFATRLPADRSASLAEALRQLPGVEAAEPNSLISLRPDNFVPNDPFFPLTNATTGQWHLNNSENPDRDINVTPAWAKGLTGQNVLIGILDDGLQWAHPDLAPNFSIADSWNWGLQIQDPSPSNFDTHGTPVAGLAAARGGNSYGVTGVAPFARLGGLRILGFPVTAAIHADAIRFRSTGASPSYSVKNHSYGPGAPFIPDPLAAQAIRDSAAAGTLHVFSAGNDFTFQTVFKELNNLPETLTVAAMGADGKAGSFGPSSSPGASVFITAPSKESGSRGLTTTDLLGSPGYGGMSNSDFTNGFGGTSGAAPIVAGAMAIVKQAVPSATMRLVKQNLARSSRKIDPLSTWTTNPAGFEFSQRYGFGLLDVDELLASLVAYPQLTSLKKFTPPTRILNAPIPDGPSVPNPTRVKFTNSTTGSVEEVRVRIKATHGRIGHLRVVVRHPSGFESTVLMNSSEDQANLDWWVMSNAFWGMSAAGEWEVQVFDVDDGFPGVLNECQMEVYIGEPIGRQRIQIQLDHEDYLGGITGFPATIRVYGRGSRTLIHQTIRYPNASGRIEFPLDLTDGSYDFWVKTGHWLSKSRLNIPLVAGNPLPIAMPLRNGDVDEDNEVSIFDYIILSQNFGRVVRGIGTDPNADLDGDGEVTIFDYIILSQNFGLEGD